MGLTSNLDLNPLNAKVRVGKNSSLILDHEEVVALARYKDAELKMLRIPFSDRSSDNNKVCLAFSQTIEKIK